MKAVSRFAIFFIVLIFLTNLALSQNTDECSKDWEDEQNDIQNHKGFWPLLPFEYFGIFLLIIIVIVE